MEFEHYEADAEWLSEQLTKKGSELIAERNLPFDLLAPAIELMSLDIMKKLVEGIVLSHGPEVTIKAITSMMQAQTEALQAKEKWLNGLKAKL